MPRSQLAGERPRRILVGQFFHESNRFNPQPTTAEALVIRRGESLLQGSRGSATTLGGILGRCEELGFQIVGGVGFTAPPSGPVEHAVYERLREEFFEMARSESFEAVALDLHGAFGTTALSDADGDLLDGLRRIVGDAVPIGAGLDMHGHVTEAMLKAADVLIACKECPHTDFADAGARVLECLAAILDGRLDPVLTIAKAPMVAMDSGLTASGPLRELKTRAADLKGGAPEVWDLSLFQVFRFADVPEPKGQAALTLSDGPSPRAAAIVEDLALWSWDNRERFRAPLPTIPQAFARIIARRGLERFVLGDMGDRVLAGAPGDSIAILAHAVRSAPGLRGAAPVTDPASVAAAEQAGVGARVRLNLGAGITPGLAPLDVDAEVVALGHGDFVVEGAFLDGEIASLGRCAVLRIDGRLTVLATSRAGLTHTPSAFTSQGIDLEAQDFIVVKSGQHFQANFEGMTPLVVESPGLSYLAKGFFDWKGARFWPEHHIDRPDLSARSFGGRFRKQNHGAEHV